MCIDGCIGDIEVDPGRVRSRDREAGGGMKLKQMDISGGGVTLGYVGSGLLLNEIKKVSVYFRAGWQTREQSNIIGLSA